MTTPAPQQNPEQVKATLTGQAVAQALAPVFTNVLPALIGQAVAQSQPSPLGQCSACLARRFQWEQANEAALRAVHTAVLTQAGISADDPRAAQVNIIPHLPEELAASMPGVAPALAILGGDGLCGPDLIPRSGLKPRILVATPGLSLSQLAGGSVGSFG